MMLLGVVLRGLVHGFLRGLIHGYRLFISPLFPGTCRYDPSCSAYALEALRRHGAWSGLILTARRLLRCHPWGSFGYDPVPVSNSARAHRRTQVGADGGHPQCQQHPCSAAGVVPPVRGSMTTRRPLP